MKRRTGQGVIIIVVGLCAVGWVASALGNHHTGSSGPTASLVTPSATGATPPVAAPTQPVFHVGDKVKTALGNFDQVFSFTAPYQQTGQYALPPDSGKEFAVADVEFCSGPQNQQSFTVTEFYYVLILPDNSRIQPSVSVKDPAFNSATLSGPNECLRGFVSYAIPMGSNKPTYVLDTNTGPLPIRWAIP